MEHECCADIIRAKADISALGKRVDDNEKDAQKWRDDHEHRQEAATEALRAEFVTVTEELKAIQQVLTNRLPPWGMLIITLMSGTIGILVGIILNVAGRLVK